jgi:hypothetical protein
MNLCLLLPIPSDLAAPHIYGLVGILIGAAIGLAFGLGWPAEEKAIFGKAPYGQLAGASYAFLGGIAGILVAWLVRLSCSA